jgi:hypothetical protein
VLRHAISGTAHINTEDKLLEEPLALAMLIDVFSERGYHAAVDIHRIEIPDHLDLTTGKLTCRTKKCSASKSASKARKSAGAKSKFSPNGAIRAQFAYAAGMIGHLLKPELPGLIERRWV